MFTFLIILLLVLLSGFIAGFFLYWRWADKKIKELAVYESKFYAANQRIGEADKERQEFIDIIMHELNTPLAITSGYLSMIIELAKDDMNPKIMELIKKSYDSTKHMTEITNELLTPSNEISSSRPQGVQIEDIVQKSVEDFTEQATKKGLSISMRPPKQMPLPLVLADPLSVRSILENLIENAIKFTSEGTIEVGVDVDGGKEAIIYVQDTGSGIPKDAQSRVFEEFFQADSSHTREVGGTGMGLYNVKNLVEKQGGRVWFETQEGKGTKFYFSLPVSM